LLQPGENAVGAILGTGWYDVHDVATWHMNTAPWRRRPRLLLALVIDYVDGKREFVVTDGSWRTSSGPILRDGIYTGEVYDARLEIPDWSRVSYKDADWKPALVVEPPKGLLFPMTCEPVRVTHTFTPVAITEPLPGVFIVDMGENFSGHTQLRVKGASGHAITMRYAEVLNADGTLNGTPIDHFMEATEPRQPFQQDTYICKGSGDTEVWEQRFSWSGFRYVEVRNFPGRPTPENFRGRFAHTDLATAGDFACSDEIANLVQRATRRSFWSNAQSYPTDCPQREKNGWTGDAGLAVEAGLTNFQAAAFYRKWLDDFADAQRPDGGLPVLVPNGGWGNGERWPGDVCPPWDAAYPVITWQLYKHTGDSRILASHIGNLNRYVEFFASHCKSDGLAPALGIGDWSPWKTATPQDFITNAYLYLNLTLMAKMYGALGNAVESQSFTRRAQQMAGLIHDRFYSPATHRYSSGSQMAQGMALYFGFVPPAEKAVVFADLVEQIEKLGHLDVGFLGAKHVTRALAEGGRADLAYKVACSRLEAPSYGYWVKTSGSTTLWEGWKAGPSYNHIMFGDISAWFYEWIAGIQQEDSSVGYRRIVFRPNPFGEITSASASYLSSQGRIACAWKLRGKTLDVRMEVPGGTTARLLPPKTSGSTSGEAQSFGPGIHEIQLAI
jgi:alpha-L-rhamnosidase